MQVALPRLLGWVVRASSFLLPALFSFLLPARCSPNRVSASTACLQPHHATCSQRCEARAGTEQGSSSREAHTRRLEEWPKDYSKTETWTWGVLVIPCHGSDAVRVSYREPQAAKSTHWISFSCFVFLSSLLSLSWARRDFLLYLVFYPATPLTSSHCPSLPPTSNICPH